MGRDVKPVRTVSDTARERDWEATRRPAGGMPVGNTRDHPDTACFRLPLAEGESSMYLVRFPEGFPGRKHAGSMPRTRPGEAASANG